MKQLRTLGIGIVVVGLLLSSAAGASAAPEWGACAKAVLRGTGSYSDKLCSVASEPGKGTYELVAGSVGKGKALKIKGLGSQTLHTVGAPGVGDVPITCQKLKGSGEPVAPDAEKEIILEFKKCTTLEGEVPCENVAKETIKTSPLAGVLAEVEGKVGTIITPESGEYLAVFQCRGVFPKIRVFGQVFGESRGDVNAISKVSVEHYTVGEYLGEPLPGYKPLTNPPTAGAPGYGVLRDEALEIGIEEGSEEEAWQPPGGRPAGEEGEVEVKGEALMIKT